MKLTIEGIKERESWEQAGITLPTFDVKEMAAYTKENPVWIHFGAGNIFRGFIAVLQQTLLDAGLEKSGIVAVDAFDYDIIDKIYKPYDNLTLLVGLKANGETVKSVIGSIAEGLKADARNQEDFPRLQGMFADASLQMVSFTITEKGYALTDMNGELLPLVKSDIEVGPSLPKHVMSVLTALIYHRYENGKSPLALVSMDNCSHNGQKLQTAVFTIAEKWAEKGYVDEAFLDYLKDEKKITFPWSMIDKITPRPAEVIEKQLADLGIEGMGLIATSKNTYIAPFVNAEIPQYLVVEDKFPNGRPALEKAGVYLTNQDTVNATEKMKVTTCLNPLHTALAVYGCLLGYQSIAEEMQDKELKKLVEKIGYEEGMPVVTNPGIIDPMTFIKEVIEQRLPNPFIPDTPQRIATDTSQKIAIRFGETIRSYVSSKELDETALTYIPLAIAGWLRYLMGVDDAGEVMALSSDPQMEYLQEIMKGIAFGNPKSVGDKLQPILSNASIFALDLYKVKIACKIEEMFAKMLEGPGAVRKTLLEYITCE